MTKQEVFRIIEKIRKQKVKKILNNTNLDAFEMSRLRLAVDITCNLIRQGVEDKGNRITERDYDKQ